MRIAQQRNLSFPPLHRPAAPARRDALLRLAAGLLLLPQLPACATGAQPHEQQQQRWPAQPVALSIIDRDSGQPLAVHRKDGRSFVAGRPGSRYAIRVSNQTAGRVLAVLSVDGVNVVSGETAAVAQTGYVLDPWGTFEIAGWRKSDSEIAAFEFATLADSYAARTGRPGNVGVIGMAVFLEKPAAPAMTPPPSPPLEQEQRFDGKARESSRASPQPQQESAGARPAAPPSAAPTGATADSAVGAAAASANSAIAEARRHAPAEEKLGTAHGQREWSVSRRTRFERLGSTLRQVVEIAYDSYANLVRAGVIAGFPPADRARAFPGSEDARGFVPDPPPAR